MPIEKSAGAVIFRKEDGKKYYLLLHYPGISHRARQDYWDLPKGHVEAGETLEETAKREIVEETGLSDIEIIPGFKETVKYFFRWEGKNVMKFVTFYLAKTGIKDVKISSEHMGFEWLFCKEAIGRLKFKNARQILKKADEFLNQSAKNNVPG